MNMIEAINDPKRPLTISPMDWITKTAKKLDDSEKNEKIQKEKDLDCVSKIDNGMDLMIKGIELVLDGIALSQRTDFKPNETQSIKKIKDLIETAIIPYSGDILKELEVFEK